MLLREKRSPELHATFIPASLISKGPVLELYFTCNITKAIVRCIWRLNREVKVGRHATPQSRTAVFNLALVQPKLHIDAAINLYKVTYSPA